MRTFPPLRDDLIIKKQIIGETISHIIKDPEKHAYYRFEEEEFFVLSQFDGKKTAEDVAKLYNERFDDELKGRDILEFASSLRNKDLLQRTDIQQNIFLYEKLISQRKSRIQLAKGSPLYFRISVIDPDLLFNKIMPYIKWIWSPACVGASILFMLSAVAVLIYNNDIVQANMAHTFDFMNQSISSLITLWITVMSVIAIHELGHGLTCKRFGGECHEIGFLFMFFTPCMYANVNDAWMFEDKKHRLYVTFAGCYIEFFIGSLAVFIWLYTQQSSFVNILAFKIVVVCFFSAIFMNFNPLMRFDGYFALSDFVEVPNLRTRSREYVGYIIKKILFRLNIDFDELTKREQWILGVYGTLSTLYIINVMCGLLLLVSGTLIKQLRVVGVILVGCLLYKIASGLIKKLITFITLVMTEHKTFFSQKIIRFCGLLIFFTSMAFSLFFPFPYRYKVTATLEPNREITIRSLASGYVEFIASKRDFNKDEIITIQKNDELISNKNVCHLDKKANRVSLQAAIANHEKAKVIKLKEIEEKLNKQLEDFNRQVKNLTIDAPFKGVFTHNLDKVEHTFLKQGDEIGHFIDTGIYRATFDILEKDLEGIDEEMNAYLILDVKPWKVFKGKVSQISSRHKQKGIARFYEVTVTFPNEDQSLRSGLNGKISLHIGNFTLPQQFIKWLKKTISLDLQI